MKTWIYLFVLFPFFGAGCAQNTVDILTLEDVEEQSIAEEDLKVNKNFELSKHTTYFATSEDGIDWTLREDPIAHYASVPELVIALGELGPFPAGTLLTYFVDGTQDHGREDVELGLIYSLDGGETWSDRVYTTMEGMPDDTIAVDPSLVVLDDGRVRLYYFDFAADPNMGGPVPDDAPEFTGFQFHSAISENGIDFTYEGLVYTTDALATDPDVVEFNDEWYLYFMSQAAVSMMVARSDDPVEFSTAEKVNNNGIPGLVVVGEEMWLFSCGAEGITRLTSEDGITFQEVDSSVLTVSNGVHCDPSPIQLEDGTYAMVFKHIRAQDLTQPVR